MDLPVRKKLPLPIPQSVSEGNRFFILIETQIDHPRPLASIPDLEIVAAPRQGVENHSDEKIPAHPLPFTFRLRNRVRRREAEHYFYSLR